MLEGVDLSKLSIESYDGSSLGAPYEAPKPPTKPDVKEGMKLYEGSCHCGAVTYTLESEPLTLVRSCDCSICRRVRFSLPQLTTHGTTDTPLPFCRKTTAGFTLPKKPSSSTAGTP